MSGVCLGITFYKASTLSSWDFSAAGVTQAAVGVCGSGVDFGIQ